MIEVRYTLLVLGNTKSLDKYYLQMLLLYSLHKASIKLIAIFFFTIFALKKSWPKAESHFLSFLWSVFFYGFQGNKYLVSRPEKWLQAQAECNNGCPYRKDSHSCNQSREPNCHENYKDMKTARSLKQKSLMWSQTVLCLTMPTIGHCKYVALTVPVNKIICRLLPLN